MGHYYSGTPVVTENLVFYLDAANMKSYPGSGGNWYDMTKGYTATIHGFSVGSTNPLYLESETSESTFYTRVYHDTWMDNTFGISGSGGWSIEEIVMIYTTDYPQCACGATCGHGYEDAGVGFNWQHTSDIEDNYYVQLNASGHSGNNSHKASGAMTVSSKFKQLNKWLHRVWYWDMGNEYNGVWINGEYCDQISIANLGGWSCYNSGDDLQLGTLHGWKHNGRRSIVRIYNKVLNGNEIRQNFNATRGRFNM